MNPMAHLTCVAHRRDELVDILERYKQAGVDNILALRGDAPAGSGEKWPKGDLEHAIELVELAREVGPFSVGVAAHPEGHPLSSDLATDRRHLASKLRVADFAITQFFFRVEDYLRMVDDLARLVVDKPVIPGIMPILNIRSVVRMAQMSGAAVPQEVARRVEAVAHDPVAVRRVGVQVACELAERLIDAGAPGLHIYTLNQSAATLEIAARLGLGEYQSAP
jgi:methylenetetrahydrofolate reductase (NADPH)